MKGEKGDGLAPTLLCLPKWQTPAPQAAPLLRLSLIKKIIPELLKNVFDLCRYLWYTLSIRHKHTGENTMLKFSKANAKTQALKNDSELADYLTDNRKIYSLDLLSGYSCPYA